MSGPASFIDLVKLCYFTVISNLSVTPDRTDKYWRCESLWVLRSPVWTEKDKLCWLFKVESLRLSAKFLWVDRAHEVTQTCSFFLAWAWIIFSILFFLVKQNKVYQKYPIMEVMDKHIFQGNHDRTVNCRMLFQPLVDIWWTFSFYLD